MLLLEWGQVFDLGGNASSLWGVRSHDIQDDILAPDDPLFVEKFRRIQARGTAFRVNHRSWRKEELPAPEEYRQARANLERVEWRVDYIVTHCAPTSIQNDLLQARSTPDAHTDFLEKARRRSRFQYWFFGHYHDNRIVQEQFVLLYEMII